MLVTRWKRVAPTLLQAMEIIRSIRVYLPDRPGALSAVTAALASHGVNILRLRVVSNDDGVAVDDIELAAGAAHEIDAAMSAFPPDVTALVLGAGLGDPVLAATRGLGAVASAPNRGIAEQRLAGWALSVLRADAASLIAVDESGANHISGAACAPPSAALRHLMGTVLAGGAPLTVEAPSSVDAFPFLGFGAAHAALAPCGPSRVLVAGRRLAVPFAPGELERFAAFSEAAGYILELCPAD